EMLALARKHENVWIDTSAYTAKRYPAALVDELERTRHKVLFGSNFPMITPERCLEDLGALDLGDAQRERFLSGNATSVFRLPGAVSG
ncbi:MAG TPA: amidohydrolase family protein, partial [Solirubrobacteraceae bacterium]|nr:amidohydrolase family protein [Solirubrobacteraceae bacterium]